MRTTDESALHVGGPVGLLLIPGLGGTPAELRYVTQALVRSGHTVLCPLLAGHGGTAEELSASTWQDWYRSAEEALDQLRSRCEVVLVGGLSVGALLALKLAADRPRDVQGCVLFSPTLWPNGWAIPRQLVLFKLIRYKWAARLFHFRECAPYGIKDERIRAFILSSLQKDGRTLDDILGRSGEVVFEFRCLADVVKKKLGNVKQPTLIFHPRFDDQSDLGNTIQLQRRLGGLCETVVLDDSYHMVTLDKQRATVVERLLGFTSWVASRDSASQGRPPQPVAIAAE